MNDDLIEKLIIDLKNYKDINTPGYEDLEFTLKHMLPKKVITKKLKILPVEKLSHLLMDKIKDTYNQLDLARFLLNEYVEYDIRERSKKLVGILKIISFSEIDLIDFLEHIMYNKYVIRNHLATQYCYVYIDKISSKNVINFEKDKEINKKIVLNFNVFQTFLEASKKRYLDGDTQFTVKKIQNTVLDPIMVKSLTIKNEIKNKAKRKSLKRPIPCEMVNETVVESFGKTNSEVPVEVLLDKRMKQ